MNRLVSHITTEKYLKTSILFLNSNSISLCDGQSCQNYGIRDVRRRPLEGGYLLRCLTEEQGTNMNMVVQCKGYHPWLNL